MKSIAVLIALVGAAAGMQPPSAGVNQVNTTLETKNPVIAQKEKGNDTAERVPEAMPTSVPPLHLGYTTYHVFASEKVNWHRALQLCTARGWDLASIDSPLEQDMLNNFLKSNGLASHLDDFFWLSGTDLGSEGNFYWMRRGNPNMNFTNWHSGMPDNYGGDENCVHLREQSVDNKWNDYPCSNLLYYICQEPRENCCPRCTK